VLVLTPSRASATRLRDRLGTRVGVATPGPLARSVGSFAFQVVRAEAAATGDRPPELLTGAEQDRLLAQLIEGDIIDRRIAWPAHLGEGVRRSRQFRSEVRAFLDEAIELDASRSELSALRDGEWAPVVDLLAEYAGVVQRMRTTALSASELTGLAVEALHSAQHVPEVDRLRVVLVDDAQELTRGGIALVAALRERGIAVIAAGDPDIASGAFRGITPEMFAELTRALGDVHVLDEQHRSHDELA
ncbi:MAG: UvrD-helicase domain-containing protein, partial [Candidatus Microbacterium stercoravium]